MLRKKPSADLKITYPIIVESGIILALLILIVCTNLSFPASDKEFSSYVESDETALILPPVVSEARNILEPPPVPKIPINIPNDEPIEPPPIEMDEFDRISRLIIPPLPNEIKIKVDYDLLKKIEQLPELIGGEEAFQRSIEYPKFARRAGIEGIVEVEFIVTESGRVINPVILRGIGAGCDSAVLNAIKMQRYKPGKKAGMPAPFKIKETVQFILLDA